MSKSITLDDIRRVLGDALRAVRGDPERVVTRVAPLDRATPDALAFCKYRGDALGEALSRTDAGLVLCADDGGLAALTEQQPTLLLVERPRLAFARVLAALFAPPRPQGVHPTAVVDPSATVDPTAHVGPMSVVGARCRVGACCVLHGHVHLYPDCRLGEDVELHAGVVLGADGFGYERNPEGAWEKVPQLGGVVIGDRVEVGANSTIDRGALGDTVIGPGTKIDNHVYVAHNVRVGRDCILVGHVMVSGSSRVGDGTWLGPGTIMTNAIGVGAEVMTGVGTVVVRDVPDGAVVAGNPARPTDELRRVQRALRRLARDEEDAP